MQQNYHCNICHQTFPPGAGHLCGGASSPCRSSCPKYPSFQPNYRSMESKLDEILRILKEGK